MSNEVHHGQQPEFEQRDLSPKPILGALAGLAVILVVSYFIVLGFYRYMDAYQKAHEPSGHPLAESRAETAKPTRELHTLRSWPCQ